MRRFYSGPEYNVHVFDPKTLAGVFKICNFEYFKNYTAFARSCKISTKFILNYNHDHIIYQFLKYSTSSLKFHIKFFIDILI
jgi:hypothetical protein